MSFEIKQVGPWARAQRHLKTSKTLLPAELHLLAKSEAELAKDKIQQAFRTRGQSNGVNWKDNTPWTYSAKGQSKPLRDSDLLMRSWEVKKNTFGWAVTIPSNARYNDGTPVSIVASLNENGAVLRLKLTKQMAAFLAMRAEELGIPPKTTGTTPIGGTIVIVVPKRSFIQSTKDAHFTTKQRLLRGFAKLKATTIAKLWGR